MENSTGRENHTKIVKHQVIVDSNNWKIVDRKLSLPGSQTKQEKGRSLWTRDDQQAFGRFHGPRIEDSESRISGSRWLEAIGRISKFYVHEPWRERAVTCSRQTNRLNNKWRFFTKQLINDYWTVDWWTNQSVRKKNTKNWYTIDALGAIFAIFPILDTFTILLQYWYLKISQNVVDIIDILANPVQPK